MITTTTDIIPGYTYKIINVIFSTRIISIFSKTEGEKALSKLIDEAKYVGAEAIVGIKAYTTANGSTCLMGTAVKLIKIK